MEEQEEKKKAWEQVKAAIDHYKKVCGNQEIAVVSCLSEIDFYTESLISDKRNVDNGLKIHGYGQLVEIVRKSLTEYHQKKQLSQEDLHWSYSQSCFHIPTFTPPNGRTTKPMGVPHTPTTKPVMASRRSNNVKMGFNVPHSLPVNLGGGGGVGSHQTNHSNPTTPSTNSRSSRTPTSIIRNTNKLSQVLENGDLQHRRTRTNKTPPSSTIHTNNNGGDNSNGSILWQHENFGRDFNNQQNINNQNDNNKNQNGNNHDVELDDLVLWPSSARKDSDRDSDKKDDTSDDDEVEVMNRQRRENRRLDIQQLPSSNVNEGGVAASLPINIQYPVRPRYPQSYRSGELPTNLYTHQQKSPDEEEEHQTEEANPEFERIMENMKIIAKSCSNHHQDGGDSFRLFGTRPQTNNRRTRVNSLRNFLQ